MDIHKKSIVRRIVPVAFAAALAISLAGCSNSVSSTTGTPATSSEALPTTSSAPSSAGMAVTDEWSVPLPSLKAVTLLQLFGRHIAFAACRRCTDADHANALYVTTIGSTRAPEMIARSQWRRGEIGWQVGTGDTVVWLDLARMPEQEQPVPWRLWAENLDTRRRWLVARNRPHETWPLPNAGKGRIVWVQGDPDGHTRDILTINTRTRRMHTVIRHVLAFNAVVAGRRVVYDDNWPPGEPHANLNRPPRTREVYSVPLAGGHVVDLGGDHHAHSPFAAGKWAVWGQPKYGDQHSLWAAPADGSAPAHLIARTANVGTLSGGDGFVAFWPERGGVRVAGVARSTEIVKIEPHGSRTYVPARFSADGHLVGFATIIHEGHANELITIRVVRVTISD
jgi:hypothetical protein